MYSSHMALASGVPDGIPSGVAVGAASVMTATAVAPSCSISHTRVDSGASVA